MINAIKFTKKGSITIVVKNTYNIVFVKISDSGPGIDKEILPKLFDKFITGSPSGTGLGLYICKNIIEAHGGNIWAKNNDENNGATFAFTLPIVAQKIGSIVKRLIIQFRIIVIFNKFSDVYKIQLFVQQIFSVFIALPVK